MRCRSGRNLQRPNLAFVTVTIFPSQNSDQFVWRRISFSYYCESHMWGLTTGCMPPWVKQLALCKFDSTANWSQQFIRLSSFTASIAKMSQLAEIQSCRGCGTRSKLPVFHKTQLLLVLFAGLAPDCWNSVKARRQKLKCVVGPAETRELSSSKICHQLRRFGFGFVGCYKMYAVWFKQFQDQT